MIRRIKYILKSKKLKSFFYRQGQLANFEESQKRPLRSEVINYLLKSLNKSKTNYLEIGVRNPQDNFAHINALNKYGVDPGVEFKSNPVDFKVNSDEFFIGLKSGKYLNPNILFDIIFIDGLHEARQVERDINNSLEFLTPEGFVVLHDCNPPTEFHARETFLYTFSPARGFWNGTVWKAFYKARLNENLSCCCIDSDWGIGIISKKKIFPPLNEDFNPFYQFEIFEKKRQESLNLKSFEDFKKYLFITKSL